MRVLPSTWRPGRISDVSAKPQYGWTSSAKQDAGGLPLLRTTDISRGPIDWSVVPRCVTSPPDPSRFLLKRNEIVVSRAGSVGLSALITDPPPSVFASYLMRLRPTKDVLPRFLALFMKSPDYWSQISEVTNGIALQNINATKLAAVELPIPPLEEQRRIVDILEDHLSRLDAAGQLLANARRRSELQRSMTLESLAPEGTPSRALGVLATNSGYGTSTKCVVNGPGVPVVRIPNLSGGQVELLDEKRVADPAVDLTRLMLEKGDLLIVRTNGSRDLIGRAAVVQPNITASFASYLIRFRMDPSRVRPEWARVMFGTPSVRRVLEAMAASSAGQYNLGLKKLNGVMIPLPPIQDQDRLLAVFDEQEWALGSLTRSLAAGNAKAQSLRRSLLAAAFSGRLTGRSTDIEMVEEMAGV